MYNVGSQVQVADAPLGPELDATAQRAQEFRSYCLNSLMGRLCRQRLRSVPVSDCSLPLVAACQPLRTQLCYGCASVLGLMPTWSRGVHLQELRRSVRSNMHLGTTVYPHLYRPTDLQMQGYTVGLKPSAAGKIQSPQAVNLATQTFRQIRSPSPQP